MARAMVVNAAQLASYSQAKQTLLSTGGSLDIPFNSDPFCFLIVKVYHHHVWQRNREQRDRNTCVQGASSLFNTVFCSCAFLSPSGYFKDNILCHFGASMISGFVTTCASMPVDIAKTRYVQVEKMKWT